MAVSLSLAALVLRLMGRPWWCQGGGGELWTGAVLSFHNSQHLFDPYTFTHVLHGFGFYALLWLVFRDSTTRAGRMTIAVALESIWEVLENTRFVIDRYREMTLALGYYGDSIANSVGDILACALGLGLASRLPVWATMGIFISIEGLLLLLIRDSLLLNVIMLIWPLEAVKMWQATG